MSRDDPFQYTQSNRQAWDASAALHAAAPDWQDLLAAAAKPGFSVLDATLTETLTALDLEGRSAGQICCNNARELLSLPSLGIVPLWGVDGAAAFLEQGRALAQASGHMPDLICADVYALPATLPKVDLLLITIGVLNWMPDLPRFFAGLADLIAPGGALVIYETHPFLEMFDPDAEDPFTPSISYFERAPYVDQNALTYDGVKHASDATGYWFQHTMGEIITGIAACGLRIERLTDHPHSNREVDYDIFAGRAAQVPMCFTLVARQPA